MAPESKEVTIYIASWGNPLAWRKVEYKCDGETKSGFTSAVCAKANHYLIYAQDSAATATSSTTLEEAVQCAQEAGLQAAKEKTTRIEPSDWTNLRPTVENTPSARQRRRKDAHPIVVGAAGRYAGYEYKAAPDQIAAEPLAKLWQAIDTKLSGAPEGANIRLHLDLTHGVNYMPVLLQTAQHLANILQAAGASAVTIDAYNTTPEDWHYVKVYHQHTTHIYFPQKPHTTAARALYYGAILHLTYLCGEEQPRHAPHALQITPHYQDRQISYTPQVQYDPVYEELLAQAACRNAPKTRTINTLKNWHIASKLPPNTSALVKHELKKIEEALQAQTKETCLKDLPKLADVAKPLQCASEDDMRNFLAHAGLIPAHIRVTPHGKDWVLHLDDCGKRREGKSATFKCLE